MHVRCRRSRRACRRFAEACRPLARHVRCTAHRSAADDSAFASRGCAHGCLMHHMWCGGVACTQLMRLFLCAGVDIGGCSRLVRVGRRQRPCQDGGSKSGSITRKAWKRSRHVSPNSRGNPVPPQRGAALRSPLRRAHAGAAPRSRRAARSTARCLRCVREPPPQSPARRRRA